MFEKDFHEQQKKAQADFFAKVDKQKQLFDNTQKELESIGSWHDWEILEKVISINSRLSEIADSEDHKEEVSKLKNTLSDLKKMAIQKIEDANKKRQSIMSKYEKDCDKIFCQKWETQAEKEVDRKEAQEVIFKGQFFVNIITENGKKVATIHDAKSAYQNIALELDEERGDKFFDTIDEAKKYAEEINSAK